MVFAVAGAPKAWQDGDAQPGRPFDFDQRPVRPLHQNQTGVPPAAAPAVTLWEASLTSTEAADVRVWDPFIRVFHWLRAAAVIIDWITDEPRWMHIWLGYLAATLIVLRVAWGFIGPENARFASFVRGPAEVFGYLGAL